jgi:hypothetical protein
MLGSAYVQLCVFEMPAFAPRMINRRPAKRGLGSEEVARDSTRETTGGH